MNTFYHLLTFIELLLWAKTGITCFDITPPSLSLTYKLLYLGSLTRKTQVSALMSCESGSSDCWTSAGASFIGYGGGGDAPVLDIGIRSCRENCNMDLWFSQIWRVRYWIIALKFKRVDCFALTWLQANLIRLASWDWLNERRASQKFRMWVSSSVRPAWGSFTENLSTWDLGALQPVYLWHVILVAWYMVYGAWYMVHGTWYMVGPGTWCGNGGRQRPLLNRHTPPTPAGSQIFIHHP